MFYNTNIFSRRNIVFVCEAAIHSKFCITCAGCFRIKKVSRLRIEAEHVGQYLQIIFITNIFEWLVLCICNNSWLLLLANKIRKNQSSAAMKQSLCAGPLGVLRMIEAVFILIVSGNQRTDVLLPEPRPIKENPIHPPDTQSDAMFLML